MLELTERQKEVLETYYDCGENKAEGARRIGISDSAFKKHLKQAQKKIAKNDFMEVDGEARPHLVFSDVHAPYHHKHAIEFLSYVHKKYNCRSHVYCGGDLFDWHRASRHLSETDAMSADEELRQAQKFSKAMSRVFPNGTLLLGNHDRIPERQLKELGVPTSVLRDYNKLYALPSGWKVKKMYEVIKDNGLDVLNEHGDGSMGVNGCINTAIAKGCSFVQGHTHSFPGVQYRANHYQVIFGANSGCICDNSSLAMRYGRYAKHKPVVGCLLVYPSDGVIGAHATFLPMDLGKAKSGE